MNRMRRSWVAVLAAVIGLGSLAAAAPAGAVASCPPVPAGHIRVGLVVDAGDGAIGVTCVVLPAGSNGMDALHARAQVLGRPPLRIDDSGLLCAIDGLPAPPACGSPSGGGYEYWSYWIARDGEWVYSSIGPAFHRLKDGDVEGWRFLRGGSGTGADRAPRASVEDGRPVSPTPTVPSTSPPPTVAPSGGGATPPAPGGPGPTAPPTGGDLPARRTPSTRPRGGSPAAPTPTSTTVPPTGEDATPEGDRSAPTTTIAATTTEADRPRVVDERVDDTAAPAVAESDGGGAGSAAGVAAAGVVVAALAAGSVVLRRRARSTADPL